MAFKKMSMRHRRGTALPSYPAGMDPKRDGPGKTSLDETESGSLGADLSIAGRPSNVTELSDRLPTDPAQLVASLALDPEQVEARAMLVQVIVEVPDTLPPDAEAEMREARSAERVRAMRLAPWAYGTWLPCIVVAWLMGVRNSTAFWCTALLVPSCSLLSFVLARRPTVVSTPTGRRAPSSSC